MSSNDANRESRDHVLELFIDGHCAHCRRFGRLVDRLDRGRRIKTFSFRHSDQHLARGLSNDSLERRMAVFSLPRQRAASGFQAVRQICRTLPLLRPLLLPLWVLGLLGVGDRLYDLLARHRVIVPSSEACASGSCALDGPPSVLARRLRRGGLAGVAGGVAAFMVWHFAATLVHIMPLTSLGVMFGKAVTGYIHPLFTQRWSLFAPEPPLQNTRLNVQCRTADGKETAWLDTDRELARNHARFRLTPSSYLLRVNRAALSGVVGVQDDGIDELMNKLERLTPEEKQVLKQALRDQSLSRMGEQRFLYRLTEYYCRQVSTQPVTATRARVLFETIPKFSKRNDPAPNMDTRQLLLDWVPMGTIDQYTAKKRGEIITAFEKLNVDELKKPQQELNP
jgi:predicted DCC family thiol-disulfide oxidoreductase YuxK